MDRRARIARLQDALSVRQRHLMSRAEAAEATLRTISDSERELLALAGTSLGGQTHFAQMLARQLGRLGRERGDLYSLREALLQGLRLGKAAEHTAEAVSGKLLLEARRSDSAKSLADWLEPRLRAGASFPTDS
jgi:hypothetical protein